MLKDNKNLNRALRHILALWLGLVDISRFTEEELKEMFKFLPDEPITFEARLQVRDSSVLRPEEFVLIEIDTGELLNEIDIEFGKRHSRAIAKKERKERMDDLLKKLR